MNSNLAWLAIEYNDFVDRLKVLETKHRVPKKVPIEKVSSDDYIEARDIQLLKKSLMSLAEQSTFIQDIYPIIEDLDLSGVDVDLLIKEQAHTNLYKRLVEYEAIITFNSQNCQTNYIYNWSAHDGSNFSANDSHHQKCYSDYYCSYDQNCTDYHDGCSIDHYHDGCNSDNSGHGGCVKDHSEDGCTQCPQFKCSDDPGVCVGNNGGHMPDDPDLCPNDYSSDDVPNYANDDYQNWTYDCGSDFVSDDSGNYAEDDSDDNARHCTNDDNNHDGTQYNYHDNNDWSSDNGSHWEIDNSSNCNRYQATCTLNYGNNFDNHG